MIKALTVTPMRPSRMARRLLIQPYISHAGRHPDAARHAGRGRLPKGRQSAERRIEAGRLRRRRGRDVRMRRCSIAWRRCSPTSSSSTATRRRATRSSSCRSSTRGSRARSCCSPKTATTRRSRRRCRPASPRTSSRACSPIGCSRSSTWRSRASSRNGRCARELRDTQDKLAERKLIERAKGIVMKQKNVGEEEAYRVMRKLAMDRNRKLARGRAADHRRLGAHELMRFGIRFGAMRAAHCTCAVRDSRAENIT